MRDEFWNNYNIEDFFKLILLSEDARSNFFKNLNQEEKEIFDALK
jgi:hypothetical protein